MEDTGQQSPHHPEAGAGEIRRRQRQGTQEEQPPCRASQCPPACPAQGHLLLHQAGQQGTEGLHEIDRDKEQQQNHAHFAILPPGDLFVEQQADAPGPHIAQNGAVAHVALQQIEGVGEVGRGNLRKNRPGKGPDGGGAHGPQSRVGPQRCVFHVLVGEAGHDGKGVDGDGGGAGKGADAQEEGGQQSQDQCRKGSEDLNAEPQELFYRPGARQGSGADHGGRDGEHSAQHRPGDGHLDGDPEEGQNFSGKAPLRGKHLPGNVRQVAPPGP